MPSTKAIKALKPYKPVRQDALRDHKNAVKLDWNEADIAPPKIVKDAMINFIENHNLHWYPDIEATALREKLSVYTGLPVEYIQAFPGSDMALDYITRVYVEAEDEVVIPYPAYDNFRIYVETCGGVVKKVINQKPLEKNVELILAHIVPATKMIYLISPTNPTGILYEVSDVERICTAMNHGIVIVDEAYFEFCQKTVAHLVKKYINLIVVRSFSKAWALANLRCAYVISDPMNIATLDKIRNGKNLSSLAQVAALAALDNPEYMLNHVKMVAENKIFLTNELEKLGLEVYSAEGNFILLKVDDASDFVDFLIKKNIFIRSQTTQPNMENFVRISIGTKNNLNSLLDAVRSYVSK